MNYLSFDYDVAKETLEICSLLFKSANEDLEGNKLITKFRNCYEYLTTLIDLQKKYSMVSSRCNVDRKDKLSQLLLKVNMKHKIDVSKSKSGNGFGLIALGHINQYDEILRVSETDMITENDAYNSAMGPFLQSDPLTRSMSNLALALYVLNEASNSSSRHYDYIESLPKTVDTYLCLTPQDIDLLQHSQYLHEITKQFFNICSHYCYLYRIFVQQKGLENCPFKDRFCFEDFRWAVSIIMSRNNAVPCKDGKPRMLALVPIWDMMNHQWGEVTTDFDDDTRSLVFYSMRDYENGDEMCMDYGTRSTLQYFMYSGFVPRNNPHDTYPLKIGFNKKDALYSKKQQVLSKINIDCNLATFNIDYLNSNVVAESMRSYLAIMLMKSDESLGRLLDSKSPERDIADYAIQVTAEITSFMSTRIKMNLSCLARMIDKVPLMGGPIIDRVGVDSVDLLRHEKQILETILSRLG